jgi:hypothetical protein
LHKARNRNTKGKVLSVASSPTVYPQDILRYPPECAEGVSSANFAQKLSEKGPSKISKADSDITRRAR